MDNKQILAEAVHAAGIPSRAKQIWIADRVIENIARSFAGYVGMVSLSFDRTPLLVNAIKAAITAYETYRGSPSAARSAFVRSLLSNSQEVFAQQVVVETPRSAIVWMPFVSGVTEFLQSYPGAEIEVERQECKIPEPVASAFLMTKIIPAALLDQASLAELIGDIRKL